jgi:hypothetical protein
MDPMEILITVFTGISAIGICILTGVLIKHHADFAKMLNVISDVKQIADNTRK